MTLLVSLIFHKLGTSLSTIPYQKTYSNIDLTYSLEVKSNHLTACIPEQLRHVI